LKTKILFILHRSPPVHGAAKVGDFISSSKKLSDKYDCRFITIKSSKNIGEIGNINLYKFISTITLYLRVMVMLLVFRPNKIYFTACIKSVAFYRDVIISTLWKSYNFFSSCEVFYHYHTKGVDKFISKSRFNMWLTKFFVSKTNIILLSESLKNDFNNLNSYKEILYLNNGVKDQLSETLFKQMNEDKFNRKGPIKALYLSNMIKSKGYFKVLELANFTKDEPIEYHFAGSWQSAEDEKEFFDYIRVNELAGRVKFHGFLDGPSKKNLFRQADLFIFPTFYENEAFPLSILEALSYGLPVISTTEGAIQSIIDDKSGVIIDSIDKLPEALNKIIQFYLNPQTSTYCRDRFVKYFSLSKFESELIKLFD